MLNLIPSTVKYFFYLGLSRILLFQPYSDQYGGQVVYTQQQAACSSKIIIQTFYTA